MSENITRADGRAVNQVVDVTRTLINGGYQETAGYDLGIKYRLPEFSFGKIVVDWKTTYVDYLEYKRDNEAETPVDPLTLIKLIQGQPNRYKFEGATQFKFQVPMERPEDRFNTLEALLERLTPPLSKDKKD